MRDEEIRGKHGENRYAGADEEPTSTSSTSTGADRIIMTPSSSGGVSEASDQETTPFELSEFLEGREEEEEGKRMVTVFHSTANFNVKHPLANTWVLWFTQPTLGRVCAFRLDSAALICNPL